MGEHQFRIDFVVNNDQSKAARQEEAEGYKRVEGIAAESIKNIGRVRDQDAQKARENVARLLSSEEVAAAARRKLIEETNRAAIQAAKEQMAATAKVTQASDQWGISAKAVLGNLTGIVGSVGGITTLAGASAALVGHWEKLAKQTRDSALEATKYRDILRELAGMAGKNAPDAGMLKQELDFRQATLMSAGDSTRLKESALGLAAVAVGKGPGAKLSDAEFSKYLESAGKLSVSKNVDAGSMGSLAGAMLLNSKGAVSSDALSRQLIAQFKVADLGALKPGQYAEQFSRAAPMVGSGDFKDLGELGAVLSGLSWGGTEVAGERIKQLSRMTRGSLLDQSKPTGAQSSPAEYFARLGANDRMSTRDILEAMSKDVLATTKARGISPETYLRQSGFGSSEEINSFKTYLGYRDQINSTLLPQARNLPTSEQAKQQLDAFRTTPLGFRQAAELSRDVSNVTMGIGAPEYVEQYKQDLFARLKTRDKDSLFGWSGEYGDSQNWWNSGAFQREMRRDLREKGAAVGMDTAIRYTDMGRGGQRANDPLDRYFNNGSEGVGQLFGEITSRGGSVMGSSQAENDLRKMVELSAKMEAHMATLAQRMPAPQPVAFQPGGNVRRGRMP